MDIRICTENMLLQAGAKVTNLGFEYMIDAVEIYLTDKDTWNKGYERGVCGAIGKKHNASACAVESCIRITLHGILRDCNPERLYRLFGLYAPTPKKAIIMIARKVAGGERIASIFN